MIRISFLLIFTVLFVNLFSGCKKDQSAEQKASVESVTPRINETKNGDQTVINIIMTDSKFLPDTIAIPTEVPIELIITNKGKMTHSFMAGKFPAGRNNGFKVDLFKNSGTTLSINKILVPGSEIVNSGNIRTQENRPAINLELKPGEQGTISCTISTGREGEWEMGCFSKIRKTVNTKLSYEGIINVE